MKKITDRLENNPMAVDIKMLCEMLSCGKDTAKKIGELAGARIKIGRRVLYSVSKIRKYLDN